jgi:hypothetical protein
MSSSRMGPQEVVTVAKRILEPVDPPPPQIGDGFAVEQLIRLVSAFLSLDDPHLQSLIYGEATNRVRICSKLGAGGKKPWELGVKER